MTGQSLSWSHMALLCRSISGYEAQNDTVLMTKEATVLALRRDPRLLKIPPYLSVLCIVLGLVWLFLLPLNEYSRRTYISENALLPGQVHTYFGGSEQNVFNAYKREIQAVTENGHAEYATETFL